MKTGEAPPVTRKRRVIIDTPRFVTSGSYMLDLALGGGWGTGRVVNVVGDRSSGKTLLAIEAGINFAQYSKASNVRYLEAEHAFDLAYARHLGMPKGVRFDSDNKLVTIQAFEQDFKLFLTDTPKPDPTLYVVDSLDSLSSDEERERDIGDATYGTERAKMMSNFFRARNADAEEANCTLFVLSQLRDKINVRFGETQTRSGGKAMDYYASQIVWLAEIGKIKREYKHVEIIQGIRTRVRVKKNKLGLPFREATLNIIFGYGIDDEKSMLAWLTEHKAESLLPCTPKQAGLDIDDARDHQDREALRQIANMLRSAVTGRWEEAEAALAPKMRKYETDEM